MRGIRKLIIGLVIILMSFLLLETHVFVADNADGPITLTYLAHEEGKEHNLLNPTFDGEPFIVNAGGFYEPFVEDHPLGVIIKHIPNAVSKHYSFAGWYYEKGGREFILRNNARFFEDTVFYAKWKPTPRFINYHLNGGINHLGNPRIFNVANNVTLETPVKRGYTFVNWYLDEEFTKLIEEVSVENQGTDNVDVYARWTENNYTIQYDSNGGAGEMLPSTHLYDIEKELRENTFTKIGHSFIGWATSKSGNVKYADQENVKNLTSTNDSVVTLYAKWKINAYTITFNTNGGNNISAITQDYNTQVTAPEVPNKLGHTFAGWYSDSELITPYVFSTMPAENITLYAKWQPNQYTITFDSNGGSVVSPKTQDYDTVVVEPATPNKVGYTFTSWYIDEQLTNTYTFTTMPAENITLYAGWKINKYTISFDSDGGSIVNSITQDYATIITKPNDPTRTGYTFVSWDILIPDTMPAKDLTITANWAINQYTITFNSNGGTLVDSITQDYNTTITKPSDPTRTGYTFAGWSPVVPTTMPAKNLTIKALWDANVDTSYKVEHYQQDVTGDGYTLKDTDNLTGTTDTEAVATPKTTYTGFSEKTDHAERVKSGNIAPDGSLILKLYYDRETYIVTFEDFNGTNLEKQTGIRHGGSATTPVNPERVGYTFDGWDQEFDVVVADLTITATYTPSTTTAYKVEHYQQNINDDEYTLKETDNLTGTTLEKTVAEAKPDANFTVQSFSQLEIAPDGSTVVEVYYERNTFEVMFVDRLDQQIGETQIIKFEASATAPDPKIDGYTFTGWDKDFGYITENLTVKATYSANTDTKYKVEHYWQNITDDNYTHNETDQLSGTTDTNIEVTANTYTGFYENTDHAERVLSGNIAGDGSLVLRLYYNRISYTVTFNDYDGMELEKQSIRHGGEANTPDEPTRVGYTFDGWDKEFNNITESLTVTATFTPNSDTNYIVEHYQQNIDNDEYELHESEQKTGTTDTTTAEIAKEYTGFVVPVINQETIAPNGSTVVKIYYNRAKREVKFVDYDDRILKTELVKYEGNATAPINLERAGYTFDKWDKGYSNVTTNLIVKALYTANENTPYEVIHYQQDVTGPDYKVVKTDELTGTTATDTVASANTYTGFIAQPYEQLKISGDGLTVIKIYYDREIYNVTFTDHNGAILKESQEVRFDGDAIAPEDPTRDGYVFVSWSPSYKNVKDNLTIKATYSANTDTAYTVKHQQQNIKDDGYTVFETVIGSGTTDTTTNETANTYEGFKTGVVTNVNIDGDGNAVVIIKYDRETYEVKFFDDDGIKQIGTTQTIRYQASATAPTTNPSRVGYTFTGWDTLFNSVENNLTIKATYSANTGTTYTVEHHKQNISDNEYTKVIDDTETKYGETDTLTDAEVKVYTGFEVGVFENINIAGDGNAVVIIKYERRTYEVKFVDHDNAPIGGTQAIRYEGSADAPIDPTRTGYEFKEWDTDFSRIIEPLTVKATYTANKDTAYTVEHHQQNVNDDGYTIIEEEKTGTTDTTTNETANTYEGFKTGVVTNVNIDGDGNAVVIIKYDRETYEVKFFDDDGIKQIGTTQTIRYQASATAPADPSRAGYKFAVWDTDFSCITGPLIVKATYTPNTNTAYTVEHHQQNILKNEYTRVDNDTETKYGQTDTPTNETAKEYTGFQYGVVTNVNIDGDGNAVVIIKYDRETYEVKFFDDDGITQIGTTQTIRYQASATAPADPSRAGYTFTGWDKNFGYITENLTVKATYNVNTTTPYKVEYYLQKINDDDYTIIEEEKTGTTDTIATAEIKTYTGFNEDESHLERKITGNIDGNGTLTLKVYYTRVIYIVSFNDHDNELIKAEEVRHGGAATAPTAPTVPGYTYDKWDKDFNNITASLTVTATYTANTNTAYKVEYYLQNINDDDYTIIEEEKTGTTDTIATASAIIYPGFAENTTHGSRVVSGVIAGDGSLVLKLYYYRNNYTVTFNGFNDVLLTTQIVRHGGAATAPTAPTVPGYTYDKWDKDFNNITASLTVTATYTANTNTAYKVEYYLQNINDDDYTIIEEEKTGTTDTIATASAIIYPGFAENTTHGSRVVSGVIAGDGSLVLKLYYYRNNYTVTFNGFNDGLLATQNVRHGGVATAPTPPTVPGYTYDKWDKDFNNITASLTVTALYTANTTTKYIVEHQQQNINDDRYTVFETVIGSGTTDTTTNETANTYEGFKTGVVTNVNIDGDGNAVVIIKYDRETYEVKFFDDDGIKQIGTTQTIRYQASATAPTTNPSRAGYTFTGWDKEFGYITENLTVKATYNVNTTTKYIVEHQQQNINDDGYTVFETVIGSGTTDTTTNETANTYEGFKTGVVTNVNIDGDGNAVVIIKYDRETYEVKFFDDDGIKQIGTTQTIRYQASATAPTTNPSRAGYTFKGWDTDFSSITGPIIVKATYNVNTTTPYKVEYYLQKINDDGYTIIEEEKTGTTDTTAIAEIKTYTGFNENENHPERKIAGNIDGNGTLTLKVYYTRVIYIVSFNDHDNTQIGETQAIRYEGSATAPADPSRAGYTFKGWDTDFSIITGPIIVKATYNVNTTTPYKVEYYLQKINDDGYTIIEEEKTGTTDTTAIAEIKTYTGFNENENHPERKIAGNIDGNGTLTLKVYYTRVIYIVSFNDHDNTQIGETQAIRYEGSATAPADPSRAGYTFKGWDTDFSIITGPIIVKATYNVNTTTPYKVEYYLQNINDDGYTIIEEEKTGTTDTTAIAEIKTYTGFNENENHPERKIAGNIDGNGTLTLKVYYTRVIYIVSFNDHDNTQIGETQAIRYEGSATAPADPSRAGYTFKGWDTDFSIITGPIIVKALYTANENTPYKVMHYQQDVTGAGYTLKDTDSLTGTTATTVTATTKSYTGFTENTTHSSRIVSGEVAANGSLVLKRYYDRKTFTVTFEDHDNTVLKTETVRYGANATPPSNPTRTGYTFRSWSGTYANVTSGRAITATYSVITYYITYVKYRTFENKAELINGFLDDFYDYLGLTSDIDTFKHGIGKTSGFDGEWYGNEEYRSKIFGANIKSGNNNYFLSHSTYQTNWKPFTDFMVTFVKVGNPDQDFWSSPYTGNLRMSQYFTNVKPGAKWSDEDMAKIPNKDIFVQCGTTKETYNVTSYENLSKLSLSGYDFIGNFISIHGYTFEHQIKQGTTGNKTYYAKFIKRDELFTDFATDYKAFYGRTPTVPELKANFANLTYIPYDIKNIFTTYDSGKWKWLGDYMIGIATSTNYSYLSALQDWNQTYWRVNVEAFFKKKNSAIITGVSYNAVSFLYYL